jgi:predicted lipoprotein
MIRKIVALAAMASLLPGCPAKPKPEADLEVTREVLGQLVNGVVVPTLEAFVADAEALSAAASAIATSRASGPADAQRDAARAAFRTAFIRWQRAEMLKVGPAGPQPAYTHGQALRDTIYAWPNVNPCRVDTVLAERGWEAQGFFETSLITATGLAVVEQLLFAASDANACPSTATVNTSGAWAALTADELALRRAQYAAAASAAVATQARKLRDAWTGGVAQKFATAGAPDSGFPTAQAALNQVFAGMFEADQRLKDARLGTPAGMTLACPMSVCPELAEARPSGLSREAVRANVEALRALMRGGFDGAGGAGFDRLLALRGAQSLADDMDQALVQSLAAIAEVPAPIDVAVTTNLGSVQATQAAVKAFTDLLKLQFVTVLSLQVPVEGAGDND